MNTPNEFDNKSDLPEKPSDAMDWGGLFPDSEVDAGIAAAFGKEGYSKSLHDRQKSLYESGTVIDMKYRLIESIGEGGMGTVWYAEQSTPIKRKVAIKLIKPGLDSKNVLARFDAERQVLALMDHPNIAKVFDGGITSLGHPYFVMELVRGTAITAWCDQNRLGLRERLELLVPVCQAIHHAHQKGIIHRDIKPSNVMVALFDGKPVPKVIDFGVAKAFGSTLTELSLHTDFGAVIGTAEYMSPEQAELNNLDIDTRSDVYSLGVLLYELLTGSTPFSRMELAERGWQEILRMIREVDPQLPSAKLSTSKARASIAAMRNIEPAALGRLLKSELDWIVMKSLEKERSRRYESASAMSHDLLRYLRYEAVEACPPRLTYRIRKFIRRYRWQVAALSVIFASLMAGVFGTAFGMIQAESQRLLAEKAQKSADANFQTARESVKKYLSIVSSSEELKSEGLEQLRRGLLRAAQEFYDRMAKQETNSALLLDVIEAHEQLGRILYEMGDYSGSIHEYAEAIKLCENETGIEHQRKRLINLIVSCAGSQYSLGNAADAVASMKRAISLRPEIESDANIENEEWIESANLFVRLGRYLTELDLAEEEIQAWDTASDLVKRIEPTSEPAASGDLWIQVHKSLGNARLLQGRLAEARQHFVEVIRIATIDHNRFPDLEDPTTDIGRGWLAIGNLEMEAGDLSAARTAIDRALPVLERLARKHPSVIPHQDARASCYLQRGNVEMAAGHFEAAAESWQRTRDLYADLIDQQPEAVGFRFAMAMVLANLGHAMHQLSRPPDAQRFTRDSLREIDLLIEQFPRNTEYAHFQAGVSSNLAALLIADKKANEAIPILEKSISSHERCVSLQPYNPEMKLALARARINAGSGYSDTLQQAKGVFHFGKAIEELSRLLEDSESSPEIQDTLARAYEARGGLHYAVGEYQLAETDLYQVVSVREEMVAKQASATNLSNLGWAWIDIAGLKRESSNPLEAMPLLENAGKQFRIAEQISSTVDRRWEVELILSRAKIFARTGDFGKANDELQIMLPKISTQQQYFSVIEMQIKAGLKDWTEALRSMSSLPPIEDIRDSRNLVELAAAWALIAEGAEENDPWFMSNNDGANLTVSCTRNKALECLELAHAKGFRNLPYFDSIPVLVRLSSEQSFENFRNRLLSFNSTDGTDSLRDNHE